MPLLKSAIKANKQNKVAKDRNKHYKNMMKTLIKNFLKMVTEDKEKALKLLPGVYSSIDTCLKKNLLKKNNAARKKAKVAKLLSPA